MARSFQQKIKNKTVLGTETIFNGVLSFKENLVITGKFDGSINATGILEIDKTAVCNVDTAKASVILIDGEIQGNLDASERIEMKTGSKVIGNIKTEKLKIDDGVDFQGQVSMIEGKSVPDIFSQGSSEYKEMISDSN